MEKKNKDSWLSCIRLIFKHLELENLYTNYTNVSTNKKMQIVKKKLSEIFIETCITNSIFSLQTFIPASFYS
jgi:hypothetical protein